MGEVGAVVVQFCVYSCSPLCHHYGWYSLLVLLLRYLVLVHGNPEVYMKTSEKGPLPPSKVCVAPLWLR